MNWRSHGATAAQLTFLLLAALLCIGTSEPTGDSGPQKILVAGWDGDE